MTSNLADLQTERERLHAAEAKTAFGAALAGTCDSVPLSSVTVFGRVLTETR